MDGNFSNAQRAEVLTAALPYIRRYRGKVVVIKYGGNAMINEQLKQQVMEDIVLLWLIGVKVVLVHGGGPEINDTMKKLGKEAQFVNGLRVTDKAIMVTKPGTPSFFRRLGMVRSFFQRKAAALSV